MSREAWLRDPALGARPVAVPACAPADPRRRRGQRNWQAGSMAEAAVEARYLRAGATLLARRWRGRGGEVDLILRAGETVVFVEVKCSATHDAAAGHLGARQVARLCAAAEEYCAGLPTGLLTDMRLDLALVDGLGRVEVLEGAIWAA